MAIKDSGSSLAFSEIETEFGQNNDRDLGEYRVSQTVGGLINQPLDAGIPQSVAVGSSEISFSDFYSKRLNVIVDYHDAAANNPADAKSKYTQAATVTGRSNGNWTVIGQFKNPPSNTGGTKTRIHVNKNIGSAKGNTTHCAVRTSSNWDSGTVLSVEIGASGKIIGAGGDGGAGGTGSSKDGGNGTDGTSALGIQYEGTSIFNNGDIIAGGGGGGGGGYRKVEREEWFSGPVYAANGGGGGGGQGLPNGTGGAVGSASGTTTFVSDGIFNDTDTSYDDAEDVSDVTDGVFRKMGMIASVDNFQNTTDSNRTAGTYNNVSYTAQGAGNNTAAFSITVNGSGTVTNVTINQSGKGYVVNNTITVNDSQLGNGGAANFKFDVASISDEFKFRRDGSTVGTNLNGDPLEVGSGVGSKRYIRVPKDNDSDNVTGGQPDEQVDNSPVNQIWRIEQFTLQNTSPGGGAGSNSSNTAGGSGGNGGNNSQAKGGGGGGGGFAASGGEGGNNNDGGAGTSSKGGNGADGTHTGSIEGENNVKGEGGTGGGNGAAIRKTNGNITVTISNDANSALFGGNAQAGDVQGVTNATGVTAG